MSVSALVFFYFVIVSIFSSIFFILFIFQLFKPISCFWSPKPTPSIYLRSIWTKFEKKKFNGKVECKYRHGLWHRCYSISNKINISGQRKKSFNNVKPLATYMMRNRNYSVGKKTGIKQDKLDAEKFKVDLQKKTKLCNKNLINIRATWTTWKNNKSKTINSIHRSKSPLNNGCSLAFVLLAYTYAHALSLIFSVCFGKVNKMYIRNLPPQVVWHMHHVDNNWHIVHLSIISYKLRMKNKNIPIRMCFFA